MRTSRLLALLVLSTALIGFAAWSFLHGTPPPQAAPEQSTASTQTAESASVPLALPESSPASGTSTDSSAREAVAAPGKAEPTRIRGRVVRGGTHAPLSGVSVTCTLVVRTVRSSNEPMIVIDGLDAASSVLRPDFAAKKRNLNPVRTSDGEGRFEFTDVATDSQYTLSAETPAGMTAEPLKDQQASDEEVLIVVRNLYAANLVATEEDGAPLGPGNCQFLRYARVTQPDECVALEQSAANSRERTRCKYVFAADCDDVRLGPFRVRVDCPGYLKEDYEFWALPFNAVMRDTELRLHREGQGSGTLVVRQECSCTEPVCAHMLEATIDLDALQPGLPSPRFKIAGLEREQRLQHIAAGTYHVRVRSTTGDFAYPAPGDPPVDVELGAGETRLRVPVSELGTVLWTLARTDSDPPDGYVVITTAKTRNAERMGFPLTDSFELRGLEAGRHKVVLRAVRIDSIDGAEWRAVENAWEVLVDVVSGQTKPVVVHGLGFGVSAR